MKHPFARRARQKGRAWRDPAWLLAFLGGIPRAHCAEPQAARRSTCVPSSAQERAARAGLSAPQSAGAGAYVGAGCWARCPDPVAGDLRVVGGDPPEPPLLPGDPVTRAHIRAFALAIACEIHPVQNLKVLRRLRHLGHDQDAVNSWAHDVVVEGLEACEALAPSAGTFLFTAMPTLAEVCLVPQLANARQFGVDLSLFPRLLAAERALPGAAGLCGGRTGATARRRARLTCRSPR